MNATLVYSCSKPLISLFSLLESNKMYCMSLCGHTPIIWGLVDIASMCWCPYNGLPWLDGLDL